MLRRRRENERDGGSQLSQEQRAHSRRDDLLLVMFAFVSATIVFGALYAVLDRSLRTWTARDLDRRATLIWKAVAPDGAVLPKEELRRRIEGVTRDEHLVGILACWRGGDSLSNEPFGAQLQCRSPLALAAIAAEGDPIIGRVGEHEVMLTAHRFGDRRENALIILQDRTFISARRQRMLQVLVIAGEIAAVALFLLARFGARIGRRRASAAARDLFRRLQREDRVSHEALPSHLRPLALDVDDALSRLRRHDQSNGSADDGPARLRRLVHEEISDAQLVVVANREPYEHQRQDGEIRLSRPPSGLVTGIEPLLRATGGTWVAHGSGNADRETADAAGRIPVPPENPEYVLRRVWLTDPEYDGYYLGFANEGLWPLCHIAHTRPTFRPDDWRAYETVNRKFARAALEEGGEGAVVLVQDYHFALVPRIIRDTAPDSVVSLFWHIPWPNSEVIGICPWKTELLDGMLGADVIGFHTRFHCLNFLETAQRYLECRVDLEAMSIEYLGQRTLVRAYPISIEYPFPAESRSEGRSLRAKLGIPPEVHVAVGVDRADYTKGLLERVAAIEWMLERYPDLIGRFVLVQLAAPSRTKIKKYRDLANDMEEAVLRVNRRFGSERYKPIVYQFRLFSPEEVRSYYAMADSALVTPLHDGMNLVAKEYVASCTEGNGALVLSAFAGAAKELDGALIVNPYDVEDVGNAIRKAVVMPAEERRARMATMIAAVKKHSIYDWSAKLLRDLAEVRRRRVRSWSSSDGRTATEVSTR
jgi:trehalose 6-phosphate synthase